MNLRAEFDAASFILGGEIRKHTKNEQTKNKQKPVNDVSTPRLSACVDEKYKLKFQWKRLAVVSSTCLKSVIVASCD